MQIFTILTILYLLAIWPMSVFIRSSIDHWLDVHLGELPRMRVVMMRSRNVSNVLAAAWPLVIFMVYYFHFRIALRCFRKAMSEE